MADWRFFSVALSGPQAGTIRDELDLGNVSITDRLKGAGSLSASIPLRSPKATAANLDEETTRIVATRDDRVMWSGPLLDATLAEGSEQIALLCEGDWNLIRRRPIRSTQGMTFGTAAAGEVRFSSVDQFRIVDDLIDHANAIRDTGVTVAYSGLPGVTRDRSYEADKGKSIGEAIEQLADVEGGFDWALEPGGTVDALTLTLRLHHPQRGRDTDYIVEWIAPASTSHGTILLDGDGQPLLDGAGNALTVGDRLLRSPGPVGVLSAGLHRSSRDLAIRATGTGSGMGADQVVAHVADPNLLGVLPLVETVGSWPDVTEQATLEAHTTRELTLRKRSTRVPMVTLDPDSEPRLSTYILGDRMRVVFDDGPWMQLDGTYRVAVRTINLDQDGAETVVMEFAPLEQFSA